MVPKYPGGLHKKSPTTRETFYLIRHVHHDLRLVPRYLNDCDKNDCDCDNMKGGGQFSRQNAICWALRFSFEIT